MEQEALNQVRVQEMEQEALNQVRTQSLRILLVEDDAFSASVIKPSGATTATSA